jgi:hypothetical protein
LQEFECGICRKSIPMDIFFDLRKSGVDVSPAWGALPAKPAEIPILGGGNEEIPAAAPEPLIPSITPVNSNETATLSWKPHDL